MLNNSKLHPDVSNQIESELANYLQTLLWIKSFTVLTTIKLPNTNVFKIGVVINGEITDMIHYQNSSNYHFKKDFKQN